MNDSVENRKKLFIEKAIKLHGNRYSYNLVNYINWKEKIIVTCNKHGNFLISPNDLLNNRNCVKCAKENKRPKMNTEKFIKNCISLGLDKRFSFEKVLYENMKSPVTFICKDHGDFVKTPSAFLHRRNCPKCTKELKRISHSNTTEQFIKKCKELGLDKRFSFEKVDYYNNSTNVIITCKEHGDFLRTPDTFVSRISTCPKCNESIGERLISDYLSDKIDYVKQHTFDGCIGYKKKLPFDFYIPSINTCIEYDGKQHFDKTSKFYSEDLLKNDNIKNKYCLDNNINLIRIKFTDKNIINEILEKIIMIKHEIR